MAALRPELIDVRIGPDPTPLLLLAEDELRLRAADPLPSEHVALLAYEDPTLKGYHATWHRYVDDQHRDRLFNTIGEARASIPPRRPLRRDLAIPPIHPHHQPQP